MRTSRQTYTCESVAIGHPDKVADQISDAVLDAYLAEDPHARVAVETLVKGGDVVLAGEITSRADPDIDAVVRQAIRDAGYDGAGPFAADYVRIHRLFTQQSNEIKRSVDGEARKSKELGAGDQGVMIGYATDETPERLPLPMAIAQRITAEMARAMGGCTVRYPMRVVPARVGPDGKALVSVLYEKGVPKEVTNVVVSLQHDFSTSSDVVERLVRDTIVPRSLGLWTGKAAVGDPSPTDVFRPPVSTAPERHVHVSVNPSGSFTFGGPNVDAGLTGRKLMVDTYGSFARHGGGAFSGKDPTKVDRSAAYMARLAAKTVVDRGVARRCEVRVVYEIGTPEPLYLDVDTFGTGVTKKALSLIKKEFDFRPEAIIERLGLRAPIYRKTAQNGHFGHDEFPWERTERLA